MKDEKELQSLMNKLISRINEISSISDYRTPVKKQYCNLARRLKLLTPMFEELKESKEPLTDDVINCLVGFDGSLLEALDLLRFGSNSSKIYLALEREKIMTKFYEVTSKLEQALDGMSFETLDISDEVKEQVELVVTQFRRAKGRVESPDEELCEDILSLYNNSSDAAMDPAVLKRVAEKLQLMKLDDLTQESVTLTEMVSTTDGDIEERIENMCNLLKKIKDFVQTENPDLGTTTDEKNLPSSCTGQTSGDGSPKSLVIPNDFRCPISLELMRDPVIVSTGQTYERSCIEKWIGTGHNTCPKTQQSLHNAFLSPNYVLRSLIAEWCEANGVELPKRPGTSNPRKTAFPFDTGVEPNRSSYLLYPSQEQAPSFPLRTYERQGGHTERQGGHAGASSSPQPLPSTFESHVLVSLRSLTLNMGHLSSRMTAMQDAHNRTFEQQTRRLEQITRMYEDLRRAIHPLYDFVYRQGMISPSAQHPSWYSPPSLTQSHFGFHGPFFQGRDQGRGYGQDSGEAIRRADSSFGSPTGRDDDDNNDGNDGG